MTLQRNRGYATLNPNRKRMEGEKAVKKEIKRMLEVALERREQDVEYALGDYSMAFEGDCLELSISSHVVARYSFTRKFLDTLNWEFKKEIRYFAYLLEQNGFEVHSDTALL